MATNAELRLQVKELKAQVKALETGVKVIDIIYPNVEEFVQWKELKYSLRSLEKNLVDVEFRVWIVGDRPEWLSDEAHFIDVPCSGKSTRIDQALKRYAVDHHPEINEEYFWMNDDIYIINPVTYADLCIPKILGDLKNRMNQYDPQTTWGRDMHATYRKLKAEKMPTLNYAIHLPYRFEKVKSKELFRLFNLEENPYVFENLYYNLFCPHLLPYALSLDESNNLLFCINRQNPNWNTVALQLKAKKFMNNSEAGMSERLKKMLMSLFPEKSRFEK
jgi:hypothetical protein